MKDDQMFNIHFVSLVEAHRCLYDSSRKDYYLSHVQDQAWAKIAEQVKATVAECKCRWKNLRGSYTKHLKKYASPEPQTSTIRPYYLADHMQFVQPFTKSRASKGSIGQSSFTSDEACAEENDPENMDERSEKDEAEEIDLTDDEVHPNALDDLEECSLSTILKARAEKRGKEVQNPNSPDDIPECSLLTIYRAKAEKRAKEVQNPNSPDDLPECSLSTVLKARAEKRAKEVQNSDSMDSLPECSLSAVLKARSEKRAKEAQNPNSLDDLPECSLSTVLKAVAEKRANEFIKPYSGLKVKRVKIDKGNFSCNAADKSAVKYFEKDEQIQNTQSLTANDDSDMHFLLSLLPDFKKMTDREKRRFKVEIMTLAGQIIDERVSSLVYSTSSNSNSSPVPP